MQFLVKLEISWGMRVVCESILLFVNYEVIMSFTLQDVMQLVDSGRHRLRVIMHGVNYRKG